MKEVWVKRKVSIKILQAHLLFFRLISFLVFNKLKTKVIIMAWCGTLSWQNALIKSICRLNVNDAEASSGSIPWTNHEKVKLSQNFKSCFNSLVRVHMLFCATFGKKLAKKILPQRFLVIEKTVELQHEFSSIHQLYQI